MSISSDGSYVAGTVVKIMCSILFSVFVDTQIEVNITWMKNGSVLGLFGDNFTSLIDDHPFNNHTSTVKFNPVGYMDSGAYMCAFGYHNTSYTSISSITPISVSVTVIGM